MFKVGNPVTYLLIFFFRATLATLSYVILAFGSLFAHLLSHLVPWVAGLCVLNLIIGREIFEKLLKPLIEFVVISNFSQLLLHSK